MGSSGTHKLQVKNVDQVNILVKDIDKAIERWSSMFSIGPWTVVRERSGTDAEGHSWKVRTGSARLGPVQIEFIQPVEGRAFQSRFLDTFGEGLYSLAFYVDDLDGEVSNLLAKGAKLLFKTGNLAYMETGEPGSIIILLEPKRVS